jgi:hypothetical protein
MHLETTLAHRLLGHAKLNCLINPCFRISRNSTDIWYSSASTLSSTSMLSVVVCNLLFVISILALLLFILPGLLKGPTEPCSSITEFVVGAS